MEQDWVVPITIVEHHRVARVKAESRTDALRKVRAAEWESLDDAERYTIKVVGACTRET